MASIYEDMAIFLFESRCGGALTLYRTNMKHQILAAMEREGPEPPPGDHYDAIREMKRKPDAMTWVPARFAPLLGFPELDHILAIEAEHSSPIPPERLIEYADIWGAFDGASEHWSFGVVVIDHYGGSRLVDLEGLWTWAREPRARKHFRQGEES